MKKIIIVLICCGMLTATVSCNKNVDIDFHKNEDEFTQKEIEDIDTSTKQNKETISDREILERLAAERCTLDDFKQKFPDYRFVNDNIYGCVLKTKSLPNTYFSFQRLNGENGFSKYILESISAPADVLLPEFLNLSFDEIEKNVEHSFMTTTLDVVCAPTSDLYVYKDNYFYEIRAHIHGEELTNEAVFIYPYSDQYLPLEEVDFSVYMKPGDDSKTVLQNLVKERISIEAFNKLFTQNFMQTDEDYIFVSVDEFSNTKFCFKRLTDILHERSVYVLYSVIGNASLLLPEYVGQSFYSLNQSTGIFEFVSNSLDIVSYRDDFLYKICYDDIKENTILKENTPVILQPYNDTWVRPW